MLKGRRSTRVRGSCSPHWFIAEWRGAAVLADMGLVHLQKHIPPASVTSDASTGKAICVGVWSILLLF